MRSDLQGVGGDLFPSRFLADRLAEDPAARDCPELANRLRARLIAWWQHVERCCGPATGVRMLFDLAAMPLFGHLGFRAADAVFDRTTVRARLIPGNAGVVGLLVTRWASHPSRLWRDAADLARDFGARWCFVLAPPFLSLVRTHGAVIREGVDFALPAVFDSRSLVAFVALTRAGAFTPRDAEGEAPIDALLASAASFQDRVRSDLQVGVANALGELTSVMRHEHAFDEALTIVYRVLFLLFAESRDLVPHRHPIYGGAYAVGALCREALRTDPAPGVWEALAAVSRLARAGCQADDLIVRPFNGRLFARRSAPALEQTPRGRPRRPTAVRDHAMRNALVALATRHERHRREEICYADLGVEQLGAVYERVLDLDPDAMGEAQAKPAAGRHSERRKRSGTFYTPQPLAEFVVRRTLGPLVAGRPADQILELRVVDPAMGSGAFLVAACRYLAAAYERALIDEGRYAEIDLDADARADIRRLIAERCLAGVDANPVAAQLARLSLWLATLAEGKPLGFLDHRLRVGNSLIGTSPDQLWHIDGRRKAAGAAGLPLFDDLDLERSLGSIARPLREMMSRRDDTVGAVKTKEHDWARLTAARSPLARWRTAASFWCARWFWPGRTPPSGPELRAAIDALLRKDVTLGAAQLDDWMEIVKRVEADRGFFHWPLEFADVFYDESGAPKDRPGFDAVIGNPPWEMLRNDDSLLRFIRESPAYGCCNRGHMNLYQPFLERALSLARAGGRVGLVLPWGLAVDDGAAELRGMLLDRAGMDTFVGLDNSAGMFPIHRGLRFAVVVASPGAPTREIRAQFGVRTGDELEALSTYPVRLSPATVAAVGGTQRRIPDLRRPHDLELLQHLTRRFPRLGDARGWHARFGRELNATDNRPSFGRQGLPVIEGKHIQPFGVDAGSASVRIAASEAARLLPDRRFEHPRLAYRDVSGVGNRLSVIAAIVPSNVVTTHTLFCLKSPLVLEQQHFLCALLNSYVANAVARLLMGGHVTTSLIEDLPAPAWDATAEARRIARLARTLSERPEARTAARLQAAVGRLYGLDATTFAKILETFPLVPREERDRTLHAFAL